MHLAEVVRVRGLLGNGSSSFHLLCLKNALDRDLAQGLIVRGTLLNAVENEMFIIITYLNLFYTLSKQE